MSATAEEIAEVLVLRLREERESEVRVFTSEQMANYLQISLGHWQKLSKANPRIWALRVVLADRGEGQELRWPLAEVMQELRPGLRKRRR